MTDEAERFDVGQLAKVVLPKILCDCGWRGLITELLHARNPFDATYDIFCCPQCRDPTEQSVRACDEPDCWGRSDSGTPFPGGYKFHCHKHPPKEST